MGENLTATLRLIQFCRAAGIRHLLFASAAAVYGKLDTLPITEEHPTNPQSPYGLQKLSGKAYGRLFAFHAGISFIALRLFNVFGPRQLVTSSYSGVISKFLLAMQSDESVVITGDGRQTRDFVYLKDVARTCVLALKRISVAAKATVVNVGTGGSTSIETLVLRLQAFFPKRTPRIRYAPRPQGNIENPQANPARAAQILKFDSGYTLDERLVELVASATHSSQRGDK